MTTHSIPITNGKGTKEIVDGTYNATVTAPGYDETTLEPTSITIDADTGEYSFTVSATGTLTLHVTDDGTDVGVPIEGATFYRCDAEGTTYGDAITSTDAGEAVFNNVPFKEEDSPTIYYKQVTSDGEHTFEDTLQSITMTQETETVEIKNEAAAEKTFNLTDAVYTGLPIADGTITLEE